MSHVVPPPQPGAQRIVIVVGPGRSGTSTVAGALQMTGLEVPGRVIGGNPTNPSGFFEPRWVVDFHKELLGTSSVATLDSSPLALERIATTASTPAVRERLRTWLSERLETQPRLVVKDPRTIWFHELWATTSRDLGIEPGFVTMLRHPAEVSASREKYYRKSEGENSRSSEIARIAGWVNVALIAEQATQGFPRNFVRYSDLVADWRKVLERVGETQRLEFNPGLDVSPHPVDDFIDPTLHRVRVDWDDVDVPDPLRGLGERVWTALTGLADDGESEARVDDVAKLRDEYLQLTEDALSLSTHAMRRLEREAVRRGRRQGRRAADEQAEAAGKATKRFWPAGRRRNRESNP